MKVEIIDKHGVSVDGRLYLHGQVVDKEENENTKKSLVASGVAKETKDIKEKNA